MTVPSPAQGTTADAACPGTVGSKPYWMGVDQYDGPCPCDLPAGHDGPHHCEHLDGDS